MFLHKCCSLVKPWRSLLGLLAVIYMIPDDLGLFICLQSMELTSYRIQFN